MSIPFENEELRNQLFECSVLLVSLLLNQYKKNIINITDFKCHVTRKISYINDNIDIIKDEIKKKNIENLINECRNISNSY